ncbi:hypothetical protein QEN19_004299 [Hanseniaspora menglaensis]
MRLVDFISNRNSYLFKSTISNLGKYHLYSTSSKTKVKTIINSTDILNDRYNIKISPLFNQICKLYNQYPEYIVLINVGSFYELYFEQAYNYSKLLNINLVNKKIAGNKYNIPFSGFPTYQISKFLNIIVKENQMKAVIVDQIDDKIDDKTKIINRKVTRIITPGTFVEAAFQESQENIFTAAIHYNQKDGTIGLAWTDLSTGELFTMTCEDSELNYQLQRINPKEVVVLESTKIKEYDDFNIKKLVQKENGINYFMSTINRNSTYVNTSLKAFSYIFSLKERKQFELLIENLSNEESNSLKILLYYLHSQFPNMLSDQESSNINLNLPISISNTKVLKLDSLTIKSLELYETMARKSCVGTLYNHLNKNITNPSSSRLLKNWISQPLTDCQKLNERYDIVHFLEKNGKFKLELIQFLKQLKDISKILQEIAIAGVGTQVGFQFESSGGANNLKNLYNLCYCLKLVDSTKQKILSSVPENKYNAAFINLIKNFQYDDISTVDNILMFIDSEFVVEEITDSYHDQTQEVREKLEEKEQIPNIFSEAVYFKTGFDLTLDELVCEYSQLISEFKILQKTLKTTFETNLKMKSVEFKNTMTRGFHLEINSGTAKQWNSVIKDPKLNVFKTQYPLLTKSANKKPTNLNLVYSEEWADIGEKIMEVTSKIKQRNNNLIKLIQKKIISESSSQIRLISSTISTLDILIAFSNFSAFHGLSRPTLKKDKSSELYLPEMKNFQLATCKPNTVTLSSKKYQVITGSNKSGKSNYLKSICYSIILAQIGCFVPTATGSIIPILKHLSYKSQAMDDINQGVSGFAFETLQIVEIFRALQPKSSFFANADKSTWDGGTLLLFDEFNKCTHWKESLGLTYTYLKQLYLWNQKETCFNHGVKIITSLHLGGEFVEYLKKVDPEFLSNGLEFWKFELVKNQFELNGAQDSKTFTEATRKTNSDLGHLINYKSYRYDYTLKPGISTKSDALKVCYEFGYPPEVLDLAEKSIQKVWKVFK